MTRRETILAALAAALSTPSQPVERNLAVPVDIPDAGLVILHDGEPGQPEVTLSPMRWHYQHRAELDVMLTASTRSDALFDDLVGQIGATIAADRTLGGLCDWVEAEAPAPRNVAPEGAAPLKAASIVVMLHYSTADPLG
jgi:hypothetical protein